MRCLGGPAHVKLEILFDKYSATTAFRGIVT